MSSREYLPRIGIGSIHINNELVTIVDDIKFYLLIVKDMKLFNLREISKSGSIKSMKIRFPSTKDIILNDSISKSFLVLRNLGYTELRRLYSFQALEFARTISEFKLELIGETEDLITFHEEIDALRNPVSRKKLSSQGPNNEKMFNETISFIKKPEGLKKTVEEIVIFDEKDTDDQTTIIPLEEPCQILIM